MIAAIQIMKLLLNNTPIDVGMIFGARSGAQVRIMVSLTPRLTVANH